MTVFEIVTTVFQIAVGLIIPILYIIFRAIRNLEMEQVRLKGEIRQNDEKIHHIHSNYKQGIEHLNERIEHLSTDMVEMKTDIKELLKFSARRSSDS